MICLECVNGLIREMPGRTEVVCCMDSRTVMSILKCNMFFRAVDDKPIVESVMPQVFAREESKEFYGKSLVEMVNEDIYKKQQESKLVDAGDVNIPLDGKVGIYERIRQVSTKRGRGRPKKA